MISYLELFPPTDREMIAELAGLMGKAEEDVAEELWRESEFE